MHYWKWHLVAESIILQTHTPIFYYFFLKNLLGTIPDSLTTAEPLVAPLSDSSSKMWRLSELKLQWEKKKIFKLFTRLGYICKKDTRMDKFTILNFSQLEEKILVTSSHSHPKTHPGILWGIKLPCYPATTPIYFGIFQKIY